MNINPGDLITWLMHYRYLILFPIVVVEGPFITVLAGFLASLGSLDFMVAYAVIVSGDLVGDLLYYCIGRYGGRPWVKRWGHYIGITESRLESLDNHFRRNPGKTLLMGKLAHGLGGPILIAAGLAKVSYREFIMYNVLGTLPKSLLLLSLGFYFGAAYQRVTHYLDILALVFFGLSILSVILYIYIPKITRKILKVKNFKDL